MNWNILRYKCKRVSLSNSRFQHCSHIQIKQQEFASLVAMYIWALNLRPTKKAWKAEPCKISFLKSVVLFESVHIVILRSVNFIYLLYYSKETLIER